MREKLRKKHSELRELMREYDVAILKMLNPKTRETIQKVIKDYLSQPGS